MNANHIDRIADYLISLRRSGTPVRHFPEAMLPQDEAQAYAVQDQLIARLTPERGRIVGYKVGLTSEAIRRQTGLGQPIVGPILAGNVHHTPANLPARQFVHLGLELEVYARMGASLPASGAPYTAQTVAPAIEALGAAFELIEDRGAEYGKLNALSLIADGSWQAGVLLAPPMQDWRGIDLLEADAAVLVDGRQVATGKAGAAMGNCLNSVAWAATRLTQLGRQLEAGMIVMTGSVVETQFPQPGSTTVGRVDGLGEISLHLE